MKTRIVLLTSLFFTLYGCQPQASAPEAAPPATAEPSPPPVQAEQAPPAAEAMPETKTVPELSEADARQLAQKGNCFACHDIDRKMIGPSFKEVAAKYRGDAGAEVRLADVIARGGSGVWGAMVMPPSPQISEADRKALARFVLSLK